MQTMITFQGGQIGLRHVQPREHAPVVGRQRQRGQLQPDLLQGGHGHARRVPVRRPQRGDRRGRPGHAGRAGGIRREPGRPVQHELREQPAVDRGAVRPDAGARCSPATSPTPGPAPPTSRCARSSARPTSPTRCSRSSATTAARSITEAQLEAEFHHWMPNTARRAAPASTSSSPSGSTPSTPPVAARTGRSSPVPVSPDPASTTRTAPAADHR